MKVYEDMAEYYDLIYSDQYDVDFYLREAKNARGPVLEVACGTGRILLRLLSESITVTGIDLSKSMLAILKRKATSLGLQPTVQVADMRDFKLEKKFRLIIVPYRSFLHLREDEDRKKTLLNFKEHLESGGRLILHTYNPSEDELNMGGTFHHLESEDFTGPEGNYRLDWYLKSENKIAHYKIVLTLANGKRKVFLMDIAYIPVRDMQKILMDCGYMNIRLYCGFDYGEFNENCKEAIWIAEK